MYFIHTHYDSLNTDVVAALQIRTHVQNDPRRVTILRKIIETKMDESKQIQLSEINSILQVLQSIVSQSFLSTSRSENPEEVHLAANIFPVISCFSKVIQFVNEGFVHVPQPLVEQFLEVAQILQIVQKDVTEDIHE